MNEVRGPLLWTIAGVLSALTALALCFAYGRSLVATPSAAAAPAVSAAPTPSPTTTAAAPTPSPSGQPASTTYDRATIESLLAQAEVIERRPQVPGYDRDCGPSEGCSFGTSWSDDTDAPDGHNGCDTRNDVLKATLVGVRFKAGSNDCDVVAGHFTDPYTDVVMEYSTEGSQIHIDHLVPLAAAWDLGAATWTQDQRTRFANDTTYELLAANGSANMSKGDSTPASWLPPNKPYRCEYVAKYLQASGAYDLPITRADAEVIGFAAKKC